MTMHDRRHISGGMADHVRGFSLIELVLVLTIISVLAAIAVPRYTGALARYRADAAARRVVADLGYARSLAKTTSADVRVRIRNDQDRIRLAGVQSLDDPTQGWDLMLADKPYYADIVSNDFPSNQLIFNGYGDPDSGGSIQVTVGTELRTVVLDADTGKAAVQ